MLNMTERKNAEQEGIHSFIQLFIYGLVLVWIDELNFPWTQ